MIVDTLNEVREVTHTSNSLLSQIRDLISPWLEPASQARYPGDIYTKMCIYCPLTL